MPIGVGSATVRSAERTGSNPCRHVVVREQQSHNEVHPLAGVGCCGAALEPGQEVRDPNIGDHASEIVSRPVADPYSDVTGKPFATAQTPGPRARGLRRRDPIGCPCPAGIARRGLMFDRLQGVLPIAVLMRLKNNANHFQSYSNCSMGAPA